MESAVSPKKAGIKELLLHKSYTIFISAHVISRFGDSIDSIAYEWMVYILTGSKLLMGTLLAVNALPNIIFSIFSGVLADRTSKKKLVVSGHFGRGIVVCLTAFLYFTKMLRPWHLFILTFINSTFESFSTPAQNSMIPLILPKDLFLSASSFSTSASTLAQLIGLGAAGFIIGVFGISGAIFIDGLTFFAAGILIFIMKIEEFKANSEAMTFRLYISNLKEGFVFVREHTLILTTILLAALTNFCLAPINVLQAPYVKDILKTGAEGLSYIGIGIMAGMMIGGLLVGQYGSRFKKSILISSGIAMLGFCYALLSFPGYINVSILPPVVIASIICFVLGISLTVSQAPMSAYTLENTPKELMGRVMSLLTMLTLCTTPLGSAMTGVVSEYVPIPLLFLIMGVIIMIFSISLLFNKKFRDA